MARTGLEMVRSADDMVILRRDQPTAEHALNQMRRRAKTGSFSRQTASNLEAPSLSLCGLPFKEPLTAL